MSIEFVTSFGREALLLTLLVSAPLLGLALIVGVMISIFQAITQIQEMTLTFVPKIIVVLVAMIIFGPWMLRILINFTSQLLLNLPNYMKM
ncbi:MAG: Flagellar biosynthetic protein FliQ [Candidatus Aerophobetes bacterium ADurb.Bin490]|nr:MAG: Flagellar biosynthetic protein FliQ [Candidatus Aerophobetes bacterium ADurb.Bin490]HNZ29152.1 flagellar biosynthesis protein FliQ [Candidatus Goldiibacteriota bacterium]HPI03037.1 flagellar biosynthesis protein FliQ [Candidatus Goldiibacteriota bacterium]HRQ43912.1 flagellar biosynthesis protein FliQ [Candidatus Goldiibacteriota bacterium]